MSNEQRPTSSGPSAVSAGGEGPSGPLTHLAKLVYSQQERHRWTDQNHPLPVDLDIARSVISAGYVRPTVVTGLLQLAALPSGVALLLHDGRVARTRWEEVATLAIQNVNGSMGALGADQVPLPATIIFDPTVAAA